MPDMVRLDVVSHSPPATPAASLGSARPAVSGSETRHFQTRLTHPPSGTQTCPGTQGAGGKVAGPQGAQGGKALGPWITLGGELHDRQQPPSGPRTTQTPMSAVQSCWGWGAVGCFLNGECL
ncbi:hypothetical protein HJG60_009206 [Phyllostomus discolor]|uniref:Uncharacterized protein n=1 Tax=Phyllostomus discolor TaxID=89673 RepID=A0A833YQ22_9CHIR|nr:hypothetical protein HJG60_009206 [Phyllostomus discolor]